MFGASRYPQHERGITALRGLYFIGLPWLHTWGSGRFEGVGRDARHIVQLICDLRAPLRARKSSDSDPAP
jgi:putative flavoprotein involved in K+ transport